jgi:hypothetical protein
MMTSFGIFVEWDVPDCCPGTSFICAKKRGQPSVAFGVFYQNWLGQLFAWSTLLVAKGGQI